MTTPPTAAHSVSVGFILRSNGVEISVQGPEEEAEYVFARLCAKYIDAPGYGARAEKDEKVVDHKALLKARIAKDRAIKNSRK